MAFMFSGCGNSDRNANNDNIGKEKRLVQEVLTIPEEITSFSDVVKGANGEILAVGRSEEKQSVWSYCVDTKEWQEEYNITELLKSAGASVEKGEILAYISTEGELFCIVNEWKEQEGELINSEYYYVKEQSVVPISINSSDVIYQAVFTNMDSIILEDISGNFYQYSKEKKQIVKTYLRSEEKGFADTFFISSGRLYIIVSDELYILDVETGEELKKEPEDEIFVKNYCIASEMEESLLTKVLKKDHEIFCFNKEGITKYSESEKENLVEGTSTCVCYQGAVLEDFFYMENETFIANFYTMEGTKLCCYSYQDVEELEKEEVITLYTLYETDEWNQLIAFYKEKHPEVIIRVETGMKSDSAVTQSEAIKKLNTALLNGQGPDIICFDGFSTENYKEYLEDLSELVQQQRDECYENILRAYENADGIYQIPVRFTGVGVVGAEQELEDFSNAEKLLSGMKLESQKISDNYFTNIVTLMCRLYIGQQEELTEEILYNSMAEFYGSLEQIRNQCGEEALGNSWFSWEEIGIRNVDLNEIFPENLENYDLSFCYITNGQAWQRMMAAERDYGIGYQEFENENDCFFATQNVLGINKYSVYKEQIMDFIEFALTERGQQAFSTFSLSVNRHVLREDLVKSDVEAWYYGDESDNGIEWKMDVLTEEQITQFEEMIKAFKQPISNNKLLVEMIREPYVEFLEEKITLEEAVSQAIRKLELFQMEN